MGASHEARARQTGDNVLHRGRELGARFQWLILINGWALVGPEVGGKAGAMFWAKEKERESEPKQLHFRPPAGRPVGQASEPRPSVQVNCFRMASRAPEVALFARATFNRFFGAEPLVWWPKEWAEDEEKEREKMMIDCFCLPIGQHAPLAKSQLCPQEAAIKAFLFPFSFFLFPLSLALFLFALRASGAINDPRRRGRARKIGPSR